MEKVIDFLLFWQFEFVVLATHWVQNSKKTKKLWLELSIVFSFDIFAIQPNFFDVSITFRLSSFIVGSFLQFLGML